MTPTLSQIIRNPLLCLFGKLAPSTDAERHRRREAAATAPTPPGSLTLRVAVAQRAAEAMPRFIFDTISAAEHYLREAFPLTGRSLNFDQYDAQDCAEGGMDALWYMLGEADDDRRQLLAAVLREVADSIDTKRDADRGEVSEQEAANRMPDGSAVPVAPTTPEVMVRLAGVLSGQCSREIAARVRRDHDPETN